MNYKEALKAAIDGQKITSDSFEDYKYICFDDKVRRFVYDDGSSFFDHENDSVVDEEWRIYRPQPKPKFAIGQFVEYCGCYYRVKEIHWIGEPNKYRYFATVGNPVYNIYATEDSLKEVE